MKYLGLLKRVLQTGKNDTFFRASKYDAKKLLAFRVVALKTARATGLVVNEDITEFDAQYDGETIHAAHIYGSKWTGADHPSNIIHELAHWATCESLERRSMPDYGLGAGPDSSSTAGIVQVMDKKDTQIEEERASMLGIFIELELGFPAGDTLRLHGWAHHWNHGMDSKPPIVAPDGEWSYDNARGFTRAVSWLIKKNLIDSEANVNWAQVSQGSADI